MLAIHMQKDRLVAPRLLNQCRKWLTFHQQKWQHRRVRKLMIAHITRVAYLSPHLLQDMGFDDITDHTIPNTQILCKGPLTVSIQNATNGADPIITVTQNDDAIDKI